MPLPDIFTEGDPSEEKLAGYFEEMYEYLVDEGVPEDRLPGPWHMLSRMVKCLDPDLFREWLDAYIAVEAEPLEEEEEDEENGSSALQPRPKPKRRPEYLRAIQSQPEQDDGEAEAEEASREDGS
jgi:hypothetical protein